MRCPGMRGASPCLLPPSEGASTINSLSGDFLTCYALLDNIDEENAQYTVVYYWATEEYDTDDPTCWNKINSSNTVQINANAGDIPSTALLVPPSVVTNLVDHLDSPKARRR